MGAFATAAGGLSEFGAASAAMAGTGAAMWKNDNDVWNAAQGDDNGNGGINGMNSLLQNALMNAIGTSTDYTNKAIQEQRGSLQAAIDSLGNSLGAATGAVNTGLFNANQAATTNVNRGLQNSQILQSPYAGMGYGAADAYSDSLGLSRPQMGSQNLVNSLFQYQQLQPQLEQLQAAAKAAGQNPFQMGNAPTAPTLFDIAQAPDKSAFANVDPVAISAAIAPNIHDYGTGRFRWTGPNIPLNDTPYNIDAQFGPGGYQTLLNNPQIRDYYKNQLQEQAYQQAMNQYNQQYGGLIAQNQAMTNQYNTDTSNFNKYSGLFNNTSNAVSNIDPNVLRNAMAASGGLFGRGM